MIPLQKLGEADSTSIKRLRNELIFIWQIRLCPEATRIINATIRTVASTTNLTGSESQLYLLVIYAVKKV